MTLSLLICMVTMVRAAVSIGSNMTFLDKSNLASCLPKDYCSKAVIGNRPSQSMLISCTGPEHGVCRHDCLLGQPALPYNPKEGARCGAVCPSGFFVKIFSTVELCRRHTSACPQGERVIVPGTSWHNTICGRPEDYVPPVGLWQRIESNVFLKKLNELAMSWLRAVPEVDYKKLCKTVSPGGRLCIKNRFQRLLAGSGELVENIYGTLNMLTSFRTARNMYNAVVKPFVKQLEPTVSIQFTQADPQWVGETLIIQTRVTIPIGLLNRYVLKTLFWYACKVCGGDGDGEEEKLIVRANETTVESFQWQYNITRGLGWSRASDGFFVHTYDVSLVVKNYRCGLFDSARVELKLYDIHLCITRWIRKGLDVNCMWKPKLHPACNCTRALLNYINPHGLCSPTCISPSFAYDSKGLEGSDDNWTLNIAHKAIDTPSRGHGRVLYGSVLPKTESFCQVTTEVFTRSPGPTADMPSAPLDVRRCNVVLVEFDVWLEPPPEGHVKDRYLPLAVRALTSKRTKSELFVPLSVEDTLQTLARQGWGDKIGVKLGSLHSSRASAYQEELAAILDWISTLQLQHNRTPQVVVVDLNVWTPKSSDFAKIANLYGSKLELIPLLSAGTLADVIRSRDYNTAYNCFKCNDEELCPRLMTVYDSQRNVVYSRPVHKFIPECREPHPEKCIVCSDEDAILVVCPDSVLPLYAEHSLGGQLTLRRHTRPQSRCLLAPAQQRAETVLQELGLLVSLHGAFLNLNTVSVFPEVTVGCDKVRPGRWTVGECTVDDPYSIKIPPEEQYPERTGLFVFEELCKRSNNRAGIVVSVPSADYVTDTNCTKVQFLNRHVKTDLWGYHRVHYSMRDLADIISDMAKWGVRRYSLGYLDYTYGHSKAPATFTELSNLINSSAAERRTLHYRYTRESNFDGTRSYTHVDGVYKLEGGMFFQQVANGTPMIRGFVLVPDMPNLRLGLSSAMNVGAPLAVSKYITWEYAEAVNFIPDGAHVLKLNYKDLVAFVDRDRDRICVHSPTSAITQSIGVRLPSFGVRSGDNDEEDEKNEGRCSRYSYIGGAVHRARVTVPILESLMPVIRGAGLMLDETNELTREEQDWLSGITAQKTHTSGPLPGRLGLTSILDSMHLMSMTLQCIKGTSSCMELGDYAENSWPQGGTGYPIAISSVAKTPYKVLIKMIILVNSGAVLSKIPCDLQPFSFGSKPTLSLQPGPGYYTRSEEATIAAVKNYVTGVGSTAVSVMQAVASLYCSGAELHHAGHPSASKKRFQNTLSCVSSTNCSTEVFRVRVSRLGVAIERNAKRAEQEVKSITHASSHASALCLSAAVLSVLVDIALLVTICITCKRNRYSKQRYRKIQ